MNKKQALFYFFARNPVLVHQLELQRDGHTNRQKAALRGCGIQNVKNKNNMIMRIFGVSTMDEAVRHAMYYGVIALKRHRVRISPLWSEALQNYHETYLLGLPEAERRKVGCEW